MIFASGRVITGADLATATATTPTPGVAPAPPAPKPRPDAAAVQAALRQTGGNKRQAAKLLGVSRSHLYTMLAAAPS